MAYGPLTKGHLSSLARGEIYQEAGNWRPDAYTLPFPERLAEFIESYFDILPADSVRRKSAMAELISIGASARDVKLARNTLSEWLTGKRDPSVSSSDSQTRDNIYRLCAALDLDMELTEELFEKVFFSRAFHLKSLKELSFFYFARKDSFAGVEGCRWYTTGLRVWEDVEKTAPPSASSVHQPIRDTVLLEDRTAAMNDTEFLHFLSSHPETFSRENQFVRARDQVREYARRACLMTQELSHAGSGSEIPYEPLINHILAYSQRKLSGTSGTVSSLKTLPAQLTTNFPTGQILRKICIGDACSYDQIYKMLCLLLFYCFHANRVPVSDIKQRFGDFLRFANLSLERDGCSELYPRQPYGGLLLFCAAQDDPIAALQDFIERSVSLESESVLLEKTKQLSGMTPDNCLSLIRSLGRDPFLVSLTVGTLSRSSCSLDPTELIHASHYDDPIGETVQLLYMRAGFSEDEKRLLECCSLLPPGGVSESLLCLLFPDKGLLTAQELKSCGWLDCTKGLWSMHYRIRRVITDLEVSGKYTRDFLDAAALIPLEKLPDEDASQLNKLLKHRHRFC
ncbi:MAG: hypothetical protein K6C12_04565 [Oscillospiraceae bacterium]|nr:hypothetical protein [Oscillospiraceae bacterium]